MSTGFIHSVKVPRLFKTTAKVVQKVAEDGASLKQLIYEKKHPNVSGHFALAVSTLKNAAQLDEILRKSQLLIKEKLLDPWLARVLIAELLWGKKVLNSEAKPIKTILSYESELRKLFESLEPQKPVIKQEKKPRYVRVNTLVWSVEDAIRSFTDSEWILLPKTPDYASYLIALSRLNGTWFVQDFHIPELLAFPPGTQFHNDYRYKNGSIILQDKSSCFPAFLLKPEPGSTVLDMCAAPGMKTTHLSAIMEDKGKIFAIEKDQRRYETLCKLVADSGATCVTTLNADSMTIDGETCPNVEYILVDPSCSGSGMSDRLMLGNDGSKCAPGRLKALQSFQVLLLRHALSSFPKVKRVVYSTCSMYPEENEMVVDEVMSNVGDSYTLQSIEELLDGEWSNFSSTDYACKEKCMYARLDTDYSNGFFVAVFERNFGVPVPEMPRRPAKKIRTNSETSNENGDKKAFKKKSNKKRKPKSQIDKNIVTVTIDEASMKKAGKKNRKRAVSEANETIETVTISGDESSDEKVGKKKKKMTKQTEFEVSMEDSVKSPIKKRKLAGQIAREAARKKKKFQKPKCSNGIRRH